MKRNEAHVHNEAHARNEVDWTFLCWGWLNFFYFWIRHVYFAPFPSTTMSKLKKTLQSSREPYLLRNKSKNQFLSSKPTTTAAVHSLHSLQATESGALSGSLAHDQRTEPAINENSRTAAATSQDVHCSPNTNMAPENEGTVSHSEFIKVTEKIMDNWMRCQLMLLQFVLKYLICEIL